jgi:glycosyltransferase involved in cell wall biosynthesis
MSMYQPERPLITVAVFCYNNAQRVTETLDSIIGQAYSPIELIIVDDHSTDNSVEVINNWSRQNDVQFTKIFHTKNTGVCKGVNEVLQNCNGKYIAFIGDDIMLPHKLENDIAVLESNPEYGFVSSKMILRNIVSGEETDAEYKPSDNLFYDYIKGDITIASPTVVYRKAVFDEVGLYDESLLFEDYDMFLRILSKFKAGFIDDYTIKYTVAGKSIQTEKEIAFHHEFFKILRKWKHLPGYWFYRNNRHQFCFCHFAVKNKREASRHLLPALTIFWKPRLYRNLVKYIFDWRSL